MGRNVYVVLSLFPLSSFFDCARYTVNLALTVHVCKVGADVMIVNLEGTDRCRKSKTANSKIETNSVNTGLCNCNYLHIGCTVVIV
jgi:hypothetical protein